VDLNQDGIPDISKLKDMFSRKTKIVVAHHVSNVLGMFLTMMVHVDNSNLLNDTLIYAVEDQVPPGLTL